jgi:hypothetical protein
MEKPQYILTHYVFSLDAIYICHFNSPQPNYNVLS